MLRSHAGVCRRAGVALVQLRVCQTLSSVSVASARTFGTSTSPLLAGFRLSALRFDDRRIGFKLPANDEHALSDSAEKGDCSDATADRKHMSKSTGTEDGAEMAMVQKDYGEENGDEGFHEDAIVVKDEKGNSLTRIRRLPLTLIEEVPLPQRILTDLELVMMAWCEEHARQYALFMTAIRIGVFTLLFIILYVFYQTTLSSERVVRGVDKMPADLRIGSVVYFDITENGTDIGRIVIGLLNEDCPLYCEYFHRRCTGNGGKGSSFRGMPLAAIVPRHCLIFGDGQEMEHDVPGFNSHYLPTEHLSEGAWRGALSSIAYGPNRESPNFVIHISSGDYKPQVFAIVIGGYNVIERMNNAGSKHGNAPKRNYVIEGCGELCTLAKSHIAPMPWKLYESVSVGYDDEKFGPRLPEDVLKHSDEVGAATVSMQQEGGSAHVRKRKWWIF
ncbi:hypothetical protein, conserved [Leishmania tarentolae]|uniref:PPIase cyclophilin-type domain-containing protein n=1 Tax=Leishmania tarentolae TaxID=5689 RepID=A0A640KYP3_LEITA|nr:hypothetical protein, conserved [Leishmania tarentolae]